MNVKFENLDSQRSYARLLKWITYLGLAGLLVSFVMYLLHSPAPRIPIRELPRYWSLPLHEYLEKTGAPTGWDWLGYLGYSDYLAYVFLVLFAAVSGLCYLLLLKELAQKGYRILFFMVIAELALILLSATDLLPSIGH